ncbi:MAG: diguanylate cyclase [Thermoanaerobaculia bacterium]
MTRPTPRVLLLQVRDLADAERHEGACFVDGSGLGGEAFSYRNLVFQPEIAWADVGPFDILVIGGAGSHSATEEHPFTAPLADVVRRWVEAGRPLLGSCWGHHFLAWAFGGEAIIDPEREEVGTFDIWLNAEGQADPLLAGTPSPFAAQLGHHDRVATLPPGFVELAYSARCRNQIIRRSGTLVYGTQFHCELDETSLRERLAMYSQAYLDGRPVDSVAARPSPEPRRILRRFFELCRQPSRHATTRRLSLSEVDSHATWQISGDGGGSVPAAVPLEVNLIVIWHPDEELLGRRYRLAPGSTLEIGRSSSCEIALKGVLSVSRRHARISYRDDQVTIQDLGSTNQTFVNDRPVEGEMPLASGDRFQVGAVHFKYLRERDPEHAYHRAIYQLVTHDGLTEIFNKRKFGEDAEREFSRARRYQRPLALMLFDVDHFKQINDQHGHLCGDYVLQRIARVCGRELRPEQTFARVGGEEFAVLCPETDLEGAAQLADRLRRVVATGRFRFAGTDLRVRCSFGVAPRGPDTPTFEALYAAADRAMYRSKAAGRDCVTVAEPERRALASGEIVPPVPPTPAP